MSVVDIEKLAGILRDAAKVEILPRFRRLDASQIRQKSEAIDLVTEADEAAEAFIKREVMAILPEATFIGEEGVAADPSLINKLADAELAIIVDPIDGTANYAAGMPLFGVMAAVVANGETVAGILYDPMGDDWVMAERGGGAWLRRPDGDSVRMRGAEAVPLDQIGMVISTTSSKKPCRNQTPSPPKNSSIPYGPLSSCWCPTSPYWC